MFSLPVRSDESLFPLGERACCPYGYLKYFSLTCFPLLNKDMMLKTFSKAHIAANQYLAVVYFFFLITTKRLEYRSSISPFPLSIILIGTFFIK